MILVILMLASVLSNIDVVELQEMNDYEETSGRASGDAEVVAMSLHQERHQRCLMVKKQTNFWLEYQ